jgi:hypothetical protein
MGKGRIQVEYDDVDSREVKGMTKRRCGYVYLSPAWIDRKVLVLLLPEKEMKK